MKKNFSILLFVALVIVVVIVGGLLAFYHTPGANNNSYINQTSTAPEGPNGTGTSENASSTPPTQHSLSYEFHVNLPNSLMLVDSQGRRTGKDPITGVFYHEIPGTGYGEDNGSGELATLGLPAGQYKLYVLGGENGSFWVEGYHSGSATGTIEIGAMETYILNLPLNTTSTLTFAGSVSSTASITAAPPHNLPLSGQ